jgi:hypothetical protein
MEGRAGVQVIRNNGEIFAVSHPQKKTGYKNPNSETNITALGGKTYIPAYTPRSKESCWGATANFSSCAHSSYKQFFEDEVSLPTVQKNPKGMGYRPKLVPYKVGSIVNQLPRRFDNAPLPGVRFCAPRNASQIKCAPSHPVPPHPVSRIRPSQGTGRSAAVESCCFLSPQWIVAGRLPARHHPLLSCTT